MHTAHRDWGHCARRTGGEAGRAGDRCKNGPPDARVSPPWRRARPSLDAIGAFPMTWCRVLLVSLALAGSTPPAPAAGPGIFGHKPKYNPAERVPELLIQLKTGRDEAQRVAAGEELRQY